LVISATGSRLLVKEDWIKKDAVIIDVAINAGKIGEDKTEIVGDVDF